MDYSNILETLKQASLFDLYRLSVAIDHQLENPQQVAEIRKRLKPGQLIRYFDPTANGLIEATVIELKRTQLLVKNTHDGQRWNIPFYWVNLDEVNTDLNVSPKTGLDKSQLSVGDIVGFPDRQNNDVFGEVIRLNQKTATIKTTANVEWRVGYQWLYLVIDGEPAVPNRIKGLIVDVK
ncbi:MAG: hypothetical protein WCK35_18640 [Chloroflexota bacterium]